MYVDTPGCVYLDWGCFYLFQIRKVLMTPHTVMFEPDLNPILDELEHQTPVSNLTDALSEWEELPAAWFQNLVESLPRRLQAVIAAHWF